MSDASTQLWFPISDILPIVEHTTTAPSVQPDERYGPQPVLHLMAQNNLFYLTTNAWPPLLVDAFDITTRQRVYAIGYSHHISAMSYPADEQRHGTPTHLGSIPLTTTERHSMFGHLLDPLRGAFRRGCEWLVLTLATDGMLRWMLHPFPHPQPPAQWRDADLEIFGVAGTWPGQILTNATHDGWLLPRFTHQVAEQLVTALTQAPHLPRGLIAVRLADRADTCDPYLVGVDLEGFYRIGTGWPWVSLDLLPDGRLLPWAGTAQPDIEPAEVPAPGQDAFTAMGVLMWLDDNNDLLVRSIHHGELDSGDPPGPPEYGNLDPETEWQLRAVEHVLRRAAARRVRLTGPATVFSPVDIETLIRTAAEAVVVGPDALDRRQRELAAHAYTLLTNDSTENPAAAEDCNDIPPVGGRP